MKKKYIILLIVFIITMIPISYGYSEKENGDIIEIAKQHVKQHSCISPDYIELFHFNSQFDKESECWIVTITCSQFSNHKIELWITERCTILSCTCSKYTNDDLSDDMDYLLNIQQTITASEKWEKQYGSYKLWSASINANFYSIYGHVPYEDEFSYFFLHPHYDDFSQEKISLEEAISLSKKILLSHFHETELSYNSYAYGSFFCNTTPYSIYCINYYRISDESLEDAYYVMIDSCSGLCVHSEKLFSRDNESITPNEFYWSDLYTFIENNGMYIREELEK